MEPQALVVEVARMFGFQRTGSELQKALEDILRSLLGEGAFVLRDGRVHLP